MPKTTLKNVFTVNDAATMIGLSASRVRWLCVHHNLGVFKGRDRLLTRGDIKKLKDTSRTPGRRPKKLTRKR